MKNLKREKITHRTALCNWLTLFLILLAIWFTLSGIFELKFIIYGVATSIVIASLCLYSFYLKGIHSDYNYFLISVNPFKFLIYFIWLMKEIVKSSISVTWNVFRGTSSLHPEIVWFRADYDNPSARALLANSITLTPGTVTIDILDDGTFSVHALTAEARDGLLDGTMQTKVAKLFGEDISYQVLQVEDVEAAGLNHETTHLTKTTFGKKGRMKQI